MADRRDITALTFPSDDHVFAVRVRECLRALPPGDLDTTIRRLRAALVAVHPGVVLSVRSIDVGLGGDRVVYVFRDGSALPRFEGSPPADPAIRVARLVSDDSGRYIEADDNAVALFGVSRHVIVGALAGTFTNPVARIADAEAVWKGLAKAGRLHSLALVGRPDGTEIPVEFVTTRDGAGPGRHVTLLWAIPFRS